MGRKICYIYDGQYPWDIRVEKISLTLRDAGYDIHLVCRNTRGESTHEMVDGIHVHRTPNSSDRIRNTLNFPFFLSPVWTGTTSRVIRNIQPDMILVRDLPLAPLAVRLARRFSIPSALDMAECYPEMVRCNWRFSRMNAVQAAANLFVRNPALADAVERYVIRRIDAIFPVVEEARQRMIGLGFPEERLTTVSNTPRLETIGKDTVSGENSNSHDENSTLRMCYLGVVNGSRGVQVVIEGIRRLRERSIRIELVVVGTGRHLRYLKDQATEAGLEDRVRFPGWIPHPDNLEVVRTSHVGLIPHLKCSHWDNTVPNKLFDYMALGMPVMASNADPVERIVNSEECGVIYESQSGEDFAEKAIALLDAKKRNQMGQNGRRAVEARYNWEQDSRHLLQGIEQLLKTGRRHP